MTSRNTNTSAGESPTSPSALSAYIGNREDWRDPLGLGYPVRESAQVSRFSITTHATDATAPGGVRESIMSTSSQNSVVDQLASLGIAGTASISSLEGEGTEARVNRYITDYTNAKGPLEPDQSATLKSRLLLQEQWAAEGNHGRGEGVASTHRRLQVATEIFHHVREVEDAGSEVVWITLSPTTIATLQRERAEEGGDEGEGSRTAPTDGPQR